MPLISEAEDKFTQYLETKGLKLTSQRRTILKKAMEAEKHFSAEELLKFSKKQDSTISKATVYRTLELLKESKILEEQDFGGGRKRYERALGVRHHDHFVCIRCGKIIEFENDEIEKLQDAEAARAEFKVVYHSLKLFGFCKRCAQ